MNRLAKLAAAFAIAALAAPGLAFGPDDFVQGPPGPGHKGPPPPPPHGEGFRDHDKDGRGDRGRPLTDAEVDLAIATLHKIDSDGAKELEELRRKDPDRISGHIRERFPRIRDFLSLKERDPQMFELRVQDIRLWRESKEMAESVAAAREADDKSKAEDLTDKLEALALEHFEIRQQIRQRELEKLEVQLERLREQLEERADEKDDLIEQHVAKLIEGDRSEW